VRLTVSRSLTEAQRHRGTEAASAKRRDDFSRLLASFRLLASLAVFGFSSFLRASVPP
jgi:hypothetical protein